MHRGFRQKLAGKKIQVIACREHFRLVMEVTERSSTMGPGGHTEALILDPLKLLAMGFLEVWAIDWSGVIELGLDD